MTKSQTDALQALGYVVSGDRVEGFGVATELLTAEEVAAFTAAHPERIRQWQTGEPLNVEERAAAAAIAANEAALRDRADVALVNLQAAWDGWAGLTAAQKDAALKLNVRVTIALARLLLRRLDST